MGNDHSKQRHGCLTTLLVFMIIANAGVAAVYVIGRSTLQKQGLPDWAFFVLPAIGVFNLVCSIALLQWKKWGFYGFVASALLAFAINLSIGLNLAQSAIGLLAIVLLYGTLQIGGQNKGWPQLD